MFHQNRFLMTSTHHEQDRHRIEQLHELLLALSTGDFAQQLPRSTANDELEAFTVLLNMLTEELRTLVAQDAFYHSQSRYQAVVVGSLQVDKDWQIQQFSSSIPQLLEHPADTLYHTPLTQYCALDTINLLNTLPTPIRTNPSQPVVLPLQFATGSGILRTYSTSFQYLHTSANIAANSPAPIQLSLIDIQRKDLQPSVFGVTTSELIAQAMPLVDRVKIAEAEAYLKAHTEAHPITITALAREVGTNEFKLKVGFKQMFHSTIYQYQQQLRMRKAIFYLTATEFPVKYIAKQLGYKTAPHFTKVFKKYYQVPPSTYRYTHRQPNNP